jgi:hypothetical protein
MFLEITGTGGPLIPDFFPPKTGNNGSLILNLIKNRNRWVFKQSDNRTNPKPYRSKWVNSIVT